MATLETFKSIDKCQCTASCTVAGKPWLVESSGGRCDSTALSKKVPSAPEKVPALGHPVEQISAWLLSLYTVLQKAGLTQYMAV